MSIKNKRIIPYYFLKFKYQTLDGCFSIMRERFNSSEEALSFVNGIRKTLHFKSLEFLSLEPVF